MLIRFVKHIAVLTAMIVSLCSIAKSAENTSLEKQVFDKDTHQIFEAIYSYKFQRADSLLHIYKKNHPTSLWSNMLFANYYWWLIMSGEEHNKELKKKFEAQLNIVINSVQKKKKPLNEDDLYYITNAYAFKSRLNMLQTEYVKGLVNLNNCIEYIQKSLGKEEHFENFLVTSGLLKYFIEYGKEHYPVSRAYLLTLPNGSKAEGIKLLDRAGKSHDAIVMTEGTYFLTKIFQEVEKDFLRGEKYSSLLAKKYPENILYQYNYYDCLLNLGKKDDAMKILIKIHHLSKTEPQITAAQRSFFINRAKKASEEYYKKQLQKQ